MDVSVIMINYNTSADTLACVDSILQKTDPKLTYEIIVVDNNSEPKDLQNLASKLPQQQNIMLTKSKLNLGFGGGNNLGANHANGKYFVFLNNDTEMKDDCLYELFCHMENNPTIGVCGARSEGETGRWMPGFFHFHDLLLNCTGLQLYELITKKHNYRIDQTENLKVDAVVGSLMFFKADAFCQVGGFDDNIFLYYEEMDICYRLKKNGFSTNYYPHCTYIHKEGKSSHSQNKWIRIRKEQQISYNYFFKKTYGWAAYLIFYWLFFIKSLVKLPFRLREFPLLILHIKGNSLVYSLKQQQTFRT